MQLSRNAKAVIAFSIMMVLGQIWMTVSPVYDPPWEPWPPIVPFMAGFAVPFMQRYFRPIQMAMTGLLLLWVWEGKRAGYLIGLILAVIATGFGGVVTLLNAMNQEWLGTLTAVCAVDVPAVMTLWYSYQGYRTPEQGR